MPKTVSIDDDVHELIKNKQKEIEDKRGMKIQIRDILGNLVKAHIETFEI